MSLEKMVNFYKKVVIHRARPKPYGFAAVSVLALTGLQGAAHAHKYRHHETNDDFAPGGGAGASSSGNDRMQRNIECSVSTTGCDRLL